MSLSDVTANSSSLHVLSPSYQVNCKKRLNFPSFSIFLGGEMGWELWRSTHFTSFLAIKWGRDLCWRMRRFAAGARFSFKQAHGEQELLSPAYRAVVPKLLGTRDRFCGRQFFHGLGGGGVEGDGFGMIQAHYIYCALYFYYYHIVVYNKIIIQLTIMRTGGGAQAVMRVMGSSCKYR